MVNLVHKFVLLASVGTWMEQVVWSTSKSICSSPSKVVVIRMSALTSIFRHIAVKRQLFISCTLLTFRNQPIEITPCLAKCEESIWVWFGLANNDVWIFFHWKFPSASLHQCISAASVHVGLFINGEHLPCLETQYLTSPPYSGSPFLLDLKRIVPNVHCSEPCCWTCKFRIFVHFVHIYFEYQSLDPLELGTFWETTQL